MDADVYFASSQVLADALTHARFVGVQGLWQFDVQVQKTVVHSAQLNPQLRRIVGFFALIHERRLGACVTGHAVN